MRQSRYRLCDERKTSKERIPMEILLSVTVCVTWTLLGRLKDLLTAAAFPPSFLPSRFKVFHRHHANIKKSTGVEGN